MHLIWLKFIFFLQLPTWPHLCCWHKIVLADIAVNNGQFYLASYSHLGPQLNSFRLRKENIGSGHYIIWTGPIEPTLLINSKTKCLLDAKITSQLLITIKLKMIKSSLDHDRSESCKGNLLTSERPKILVINGLIRQDLEMPSHLKTGGWVLVYVGHYSRLYGVMLWPCLTSIIVVNTIAQGVYWII